MSKSSILCLIGSIYRHFVLNRRWKRDSLQIMTFISVCSTWGIVDLKTRFETWITRNDVNRVRLFHLSYFQHLWLPCSHKGHQMPKSWFLFDWSIYRLFVLNTGWKFDSLQIIIFLYVCFTWGIFELKSRFETSITRNGVKGVCLFPLSYLITLMTYLCSQRTQNFQIKYFMLELSI
jgi:hypothetical protein